MMEQWKSKLDFVATMSMVIASATVVWALWSRPEPRPPEFVRSKVPVPARLLSLEGATLKGKLTAPVIILEFSEFQCPFCARFAKLSLPELAKQYIETGKVLLAFRHLPLERIHPFAFRASEVALCAGTDGKFWPVHDALFREPKISSTDDVLSRAVSAGVNPSSLDGCLKGGQVAQRVRSDIELATSLGVSSTPVFLIGFQVENQLRVSEVLLGARPTADFGRAINALLARMK